MHSNSRAHFLGLAVMCAVAFAALPARAGTFDPPTGTVSTNGAITWSLDSLASLPDSLLLTASDSSMSPVDLQSLEFGTQAIEGAGALRIGGAVTMLKLELAHPEALRGRRIQVTLWQRAAGTAAVGALRWMAPSAGAPKVVGQTVLLPTGRQTDDGWVEVSTGPVDALLGGRLAPTLLFTDAQVTLGGYGGGQGITADTAARVAVDALEIEDLGPAAVADKLCKLPTEDADCGTQGLCYYGRCADAAAVTGPVLPGALRDEYVARRIFEFEHFTGIRALDAIVPQFEAAMETVRTGPVKKFWSGIMAAWNLGRDPHGYPPVMNWLSSPSVLGICTHLGEADLLPPLAAGGAAKAPLVFSRQADGAFAALKVGDALTAIDGLPVDEWRAKASRMFFIQGDRGADAVLASPDIPAAAARVGSTLTFTRCPATIAATRPCTAAELVTVDVDLRTAFGASLWAGFDVNWRREGDGCDWRFLRVPSTDTIGDYMHAASADDGDVRILEFNGVPEERDPSSAAWVQTVDTALSPPMSNFILDERQGDGGTFDSVVDIASRLLPASLAVATDLYPRLERPLDVPTAQRFLSCSTGSFFGYDSCGMFYSQDLRSSNAGILKDARLAILTSMDVSGNDFLTRFLTYRTGPTRIFGPGPTEGGFGNITMAVAHTSEMFGGAFQMTDAAYRVGPLASPPQVESLTGVPADEAVFQKQSDLVAGRDTLVETAKTWLRQ